MTRSMWIRFGFTARVIAGVTLGTATLSSSVAAQVPGPSRTFVSVGSCLDLSHESGAVEMERRAPSAFDIPSMVDADLVPGDASPRVTGAPTRVDIPEEVIVEMLPMVGHTRRGSHALIGMLIGGAAGYALGYAIADPDRPDPNDFIQFSQEDQRVMSGTIGMLVGAGVGALIGIASGGDHARVEESHPPHSERGTP